MHRLGTSVHCYMTIILRAPKHIERAHGGDGVLGTYYPAIRLSIGDDSE